MAGQEVHFDRNGVAGVITLDRPQALNALTAGMAAAILEQLAIWADDDGVDRVVIRANGEKAFCAGGDIRNLYDWGLAGDPRARDFYRVEYTLNTAIKHYPKPFVALIDGIVMGGGVGLSVHGSHRVGSEAVTFAMPETGIGLFPDVGGTFFLPRMRGETGMFLGLTGARLKSADALHVGVLTHAASRADLPELFEALAAPGDEDAIIGRFGGATEEAPLKAVETLIDRHFSARSVEDILASLDRAAEGVDGEWAARQAATLRTKSPTSLKIAFRQLRQGQGLDFRDSMRLEYRIVTRILAATDFFEGVRAVIIDKDQQPRWRPDRLDAVTDEQIDAYFAPLPDELEV